MVDDFDKRLKALESEMLEVRRLKLMKEHSQENDDLDTPAEWVCEPDHTEQWILFIDPGKHTGWARFSHLTGKARGHGIVVGLDALQKFLMMNTGDMLPVRVVCESYRIRNNALNNGNLSVHQREGHEVTLKAIGKIKTWCEIFEVPYEEVEPQMREVGYRQGNIPRAKDHKLSHDRDALAHGVAWLVKRGIRKVKRREFNPHDSKPGV